MEDRIERKLKNYGTGQTETKEKKMERETTETK
jgi:hypothetical protein